MATYITYLRVSTQRQGQSGLGLEAQRAAVQQMVGTQGTILREYIEIESGKKTNRKELLKALEESKATGATLLIAKLDRLARNVAFTSWLMESGVNFVCADNPNANRLTIHIFAAIAEDEARRISERTRAALQAKKARGFTLGSPQNLSDEDRSKGRDVMQQNAREASKQVTMLIPLLLQQRKTLREVAQILNDTGYRTRRGKEFSATQVMRLAKPQQPIQATPAE